MGGLLDESQLPKFTGIKYYFNSYTRRGRMNFVFATYGSLALAYLIFGGKKKQPAVEEKK